MVPMVKRRGRRYHSYLQVCEESESDITLFSFVYMFFNSYLNSCRELGIGIVAYSPLGRGFLAAGPKLAENFEDDDYRKASTLRIQ